MNILFCQKKNLEFGFFTLLVCTEEIELGLPAIDEDCDETNYIRKPGRRWR